MEEGWVVEYSCMSELKGLVSASAETMLSDLPDGTPSTRTNSTEWQSTPRDSGGSSLAASISNSERLHKRRSCIPEALLLKQGSFGAAVFSLASSAIGSGSLALPYMLKSTGICSGIVMLIVGAVLSHLSLEVLMVATRRTGSRSLADLVALATGHRAARGAVNGVVAVYGVSAVLCCLVFIGDFFCGIAHSPLIDVQISRSSAICLVAVCVVWPLALPRSLSALRYASALSIAAIGFITLAVVCKAPTYAALRQMEGEFALLGEDNHLGEDGLLWWSGDPRAWLRAFGIALFAFAAQTNAVPVAYGLHEVDTNQVRWVSLCSMSLALAVYVPLALCGYLSFRGGTHQDFILNYPDDDVVMLLVRCCCLASMCISVPINLSPAAQSIAGFASGALNKHPAALHRGIVTVVVAICTLVATRSEHIAGIIGLIGAGLGSIVVLVLPALICRNLLVQSSAPQKAARLSGILFAASALGFAAFCLQVFNM